MSGWRALSDDELRARLWQRGLSPEYAELFIRQRDDAEYADSIDEMLGEED